MVGPQRWLVLALVLLLWSVGAGAAEDRDQTEIDIGKQLTAAYEKSGHEVNRGDDVLPHLQELVTRMAPATGRDLPYTVVGVVERPDVNAITFPGGFIYVFRGLVDLHLSDDQLAGVLGHEMAHAALSHGYKKLLELALLHKLQDRLGQSSNGAVLTSPLQVTNVLLISGVGRHFENQADYWGVKYAGQSGFDPRGLLQALHILEGLEKQHPGVMTRLLATHPPTAERIQRVTRELQETGGPAGVTAISSGRR